MLGNMHRLLIALSIVAIHYCNSANVLINHDADLIDYVTENPTEDKLIIKFAERIPSAERTRILNDSFARLARQDLTKQILELHLNDNQLTTPPILAGLSSLLLLNLSRNQLTEPPMVTGLSALRGLILWSNQLTEPPVLTGLSALQKLSLANNQLTTTPNLTGLSSLQNLNLEHNQLTTTPNLTGLLSLQHLNLEHNQLAEPPMLTGLSALTLLSLGNNPLTMPLYVPAALKGRVLILGYTNRIYKPINQELLNSLLTHEQIKEIIRYIMQLDTPAQAELIAKVWLNQQNPDIQASETNIIFCGQHLFFTEDGLEAWNFFNGYELKPLHGELFIMKLPLHSIDALLTALYGNYDLDQLPIEDPVSHTDFVVTDDEFMRLVHHFISKYGLTPLTDAEIDSCKNEEKYVLKELARIIQQKKNPSPTQKFIDSEDAIQLIKQSLEQAGLPLVEDSTIATFLRPLTTAAGTINRASLKKFLQSYIRNRTATVSKDEAIVIIQQTLQQAELAPMSDTDLENFLRPLTSSNDKINSSALDNALEQRIRQLKMKKS